MFRRRQPPPMPTHETLHVVRMSAPQWFAKTSDVVVRCETCDLFKVLPARSDATWDLVNNHRKTGAAA